MPCWQYNHRVAVAREAAGWAAVLAAARAAAARARAAVAREAVARARAEAARAKAAAERARAAGRKEIFLKWIKFTYTIKFYHPW